MKVKKSTKYLIYAICTAIVIYAIYITVAPGPIIDNFDDLEDEYTTIVNLIEKYYNQQFEGENIVIDIDIDTHTDEYQLYHNDIEIKMSSYEQNCLEKICKENYYRRYRIVRVTEFDISFWEYDKTEYAMVYTKNLRQTRKMIKRLSSDECKFKRVKGQWYELSNYHR